MDFNIIELLSHEKMIFLAIVSCGLYTGYTDFRYGKISNAYTAFLIGFGIISQVLFINEGSIPWIHSCVVIIGGLGLAFFMFYVGIWAAGDAKLFWGISLLIPPSVFIGSAETQFYPLILLINIFVLFLCYVTLILILKTTSQQQKQVVFQSFIAEVKQFPRRLVQIFAYIGIGGLAFYMPSQLEIEVDLAVRVSLFLVIVIVMNKLVEKYIPRKYVLAFHIPFLFLAFFFGFPSLLQLGVSIVFIFFISWFIFTFGSFVRLLFTKEMAIEDLRPKMIPAERVVKMGQEGVTDRYVKVFAGFANPAQANIVVDISSEGLTPLQVETLQDISKTDSVNGFGDSLRIQEKIPFAFMIVIGALVTILANGMVYSLVRDVELIRFIERVLLYFTGG